MILIDSYRLGNGTTAANAAHKITVINLQSIGSSLTGSVNVSSFKTKAAAETEADVTTRPDNPNFIVDRSFSFSSLARLGGETIEAAIYRWLLTQSVFSGGRIDLIP